VQAGDEVVLLPGTYVLSSELTVSKAISLGGRRGKPKPTVVGSGPMTNVIWGAAAGDTLHDAKVQGGNFGAIAGFDLAERVEAVGVSTGCGTNVLLRDSVCVATGINGVALSYAAGCASPSVLPPIHVRNVTVIASGANGTAIRVSAATGCDLTLEGRNVIAIGGGSDLTAEVDINASSRAEIDLSHSAFNDVVKSGANAFAPAPGTNGNISAEPLLADPANGDYTQLVGSPTIDAGRRDDRLGSFDFGGGRRVVGKRPDIGADEFDLACKGRSATIVGSGGGPIVGTNGADVIVGTPRADTIRALGGNDLVCAGGGNDRVKGGAGADEIRGQGGNDRLSGGGGRDRLYGQAGRDKLVGGGGKGDLCHGGPGKDKAKRSCEKVRSA